MTKISSGLENFDLKALIQPEIRTERDAIKFLEEYLGLPSDRAADTPEFRNALEGLDFLRGSQVTKDAVDILQRLLKDPSQDIVIAAIHALPEDPHPLDREEIKKSVIELACQEPTTDGLAVQGRALEYLNKVFGRDAASACSEKMLKSSGGVVRALIKAALN